MDTIRVLDIVKVSDCRKVSNCICNTVTTDFHWKIYIFYSDCKYSHQTAAVKYQTAEKYQTAMLYKSWVVQSGLKIFLFSLQ